MARALPRTPGSEFSGLYFDPRDKRRACVNIQHPTSRNDRTIEITIANDDEHWDDACELAPSAPQNFAP